MKFLQKVVIKVAIHSDWKNVNSTLIRFPLGGRESVNYFITCFRSSKEDREGAPDSVTVEKTGFAGGSIKKIF